MIKDQTVLITGASGGIGADFADIFARNGYNLVLIARNDLALEQLAERLTSRYQVSVKVLPKDLSLPNAADEALDFLQNESIKIDVLVNNAGMGTFGPFADTDFIALTQLMNLNIVTVTQLTRLLLPPMLSRKRGKILNVASTAAFQPGPLMAAYYASKAYVLWLSEALANELKGTGVTVTALCPGPVRTGFQKRANMEDSGLLSGKLLSVMDSKTVAEIGYKGLMKEKEIVIPGLLNKVGAFGVRVAPRKIVTQITRKIQEKR
jgi:uncharacterized protein